MGDILDKADGKARREIRCYPPPDSRYRGGRSGIDAPIFNIYISGNTGYTAHFSRNTNTLTHMSMR